MRIDCRPISGVRRLYRRRGPRLVIAIAIALAIEAIAMPAQAQVASAPLSGSPEWSFAVTPYAWLPTISSTYDSKGPRGGKVEASIDAGIGDYLSDLNFTTMLGAQARYGQFSLMTDFVYLNASLTTGVSRLSSVNPGSGPIDIPRDQQLGTGTRLASSIWTMAGGYTLLDGDWGYLDVIAGFRMLSFNATTNYSLSVDITAPDRSIALSRVGSVTTSRTLFTGIGGLAARINIPGSKFYVPFYFDAGSGGVPFTWQIYSGVGYSPASWVDVSAGYRYLTFQNGGANGVRNLSLGGAILVANFKF